MSGALWDTWSMIWDFSAINLNGNMLFRNKFHVGPWKRFKYFYWSMRMIPCFSNPSVGSNMSERVKPTGFENLCDFIFPMAIISCFCKFTASNLNFKTFGSCKKSELHQMGPKCDIWSACSMQTCYLRRLLDKYPLISSVKKFYNFHFHCALEIFYPTDSSLHPLNRDVSSNQSFVESRYQKQGVSMNQGDNTVNSQPSKDGYHPF